MAPSNIADDMSHVVDDVDSDWSVHSLMLSLYDLHDLLMQRPPSNIPRNNGFQQRVMAADTAEPRQPVTLAG